jgi:putative SOS response-associated peptidase YedK
LVPVTGFYEWRLEGKKKEPYQFSLANDATFAFAGLYDTWKHPATESVLTTFTIITTSANAMMHPYHDRMPVVIEKAFDDLWLSPEHPKEQLMDFLKKEQKVEFVLDVGKV